jgi:hypothetical protein
LREDQPLENDPSALRRDIHAKWVESLKGVRDGLTSSEIAFEAEFKRPSTVPPAKAEASR